MGIDLTLLIKLLTPVVPLLLKSGEKTADGLLHKIGSDTWDKMKPVLDKLRSHVNKDTEAKEAVQLFIEEPNSKASEAFLRTQLTKILENDDELAQEIALLMETKSDDVQRGSERKTQKGNKNIMIDEGNDISIQIS